MISETEPIVISAYSWGGPVASYAIKALNEKTYGFYTAGLITVGTPVSNGDMPSNPANLGSALDFHIHLYHPDDIVAQTAGGLTYDNDFTINIAVGAKETLLPGQVENYMNGYRIHVGFPRNNAVRDAINGIKNKFK